VQALGAWVQQSRDRECLWITSLAGIRGTARQRSCRLVQACGAQPSRDLNACVLPAWQALGAQYDRDCADLRGGSLGDHGAKEQAQGPEIPQPMEQRIHRPMGQGLACSAYDSFSKLWCGEAFHELGAQSTDVAALPCALPLPSVSPSSQQSPWFTELTWSVAVSQSPSWISRLF
jgi:hypothetical protein